jgi:PPM family protein phosphatase
MQAAYSSRNARAVGGTGRMTKDVMKIDLQQVQYEFGLACDIGRVRKDGPNQDTAAVVLPQPGEPWHPPLLLVADGLGRYQGGALASQTVVNAFTQAFEQSQHPADYPALMKRCVRIAHRQVRDLGERDAALALMGSTIAAVTLHEESLFVLNVGDSRAYLLDEERIRQVSQDHSWAAAQERAGLLTEAEARTHPNRNRLTMAITAKRTKIEMYCAEEKLEPNDVILLCSDGLWSVVPLTLIRAVAAELPPQVAADKLVSMANSSAGPDNISVVIARRAGMERNNASADVQDTGP